MRILYLLLCILFYGVISGQNIESGEQAKGYEHNKNVSVDYSTGLFHYTIPLFELKSNNFILPVSLNYIGSGVRPKDEQPGIIGYNWSLQYGGIVTRTVKGGIADESGLGGSAYTENMSNALPLAEDIVGVNKRKRDGERDIFTAVFNGRVINFLVRGTTNRLHEYMIEPLEKTNVKIEFESDGRQITKWIITDEDGTRYTYSVLEWTCNYTRQEQVGINSVIDGGHISAWYISKIEIPNDRTIHFKYDPRFIYDSSFDLFPDQMPLRDKNYNEYVQNAVVKYKYGRSISELALNFDKYKQEFERYIQLAGEEIVHQSFVDQVEYLYNLRLDYHSNMDYFFRMNKLRLKEELLGVLTDIKDVGVASQGIINALNQMIRMTSGMASTYLMYAKECMKRCLSEECHCSEKTTGSMCYYKIYSPLLCSISNDLECIRFNYNPNGTSHVLKSISKQDYLDNSITMIELNGTPLLHGITWKGHDGIPYQQQTFTYHLPEVNCDSVNMWGDYTPPASNEPFDPRIPRICYAKKNSLESISSSGAKISIDYESNEYYKIITNDCGTHGGIRIKSLVFESDDTRDSVLFRYPSPGASIYRILTDRERIQYALFSDSVIYSRVMCQGNNSVEKGNRGLFYPCVEEVFVGKGKNAYLYTIPPTSDYTPFWICGLLVGKAIYDESGYLVSFMKREYYGDVNRSWENYNVYLNNYFRTCISQIQTPPEPFLFSQAAVQIPAYNYYMDSLELDNSYRAQQPILIYNDSPAEMCIVRPYENIFVNNILPRTRVVLPFQNYKINYGGKVVLKRQIEYVFSSSNSKREILYLMTGNLPSNKHIVSDIEYTYDNPMYCTQPTKIIQHLSNGDEKIIVRYTANDFTYSAHPIIAKMQQANIITPIIKEQTLVKKAGSTQYLLQKEKVSLYQAFHDTLPLLSCHLLFNSGDEEIPILVTPGLQNSLFTRDTNLYTKLQHISYTQNEERYLPEKIISKNETTQFIFDPTRDNLVLRVKDTDKSSIDVADMYRYYHLHEIRGNIMQYADKMANWRSACNLYMTGFGKIDSMRLNSYEFENLKILFELSRQVLNRDTSLLALNSDKLTSIARALGYLQDVGYRFEMEYPRTQQMEFLSCIDEMLTIFYDGGQLQEIASVILNMNWNPELLGLNKPEKLEIKPIHTITKYQMIFVLYSNVDQAFVPICKKIQGNQEISCTISAIPLKGGVWQVACQEVEVTGTGISAIRVQIPSNLKTALAILAPSGTSFEVVSTDSFGQQFCRLNQNGNMERYEYDAAGRVSKIFDQDGNLLKENSYNVIF